MFRQFGLNELLMLVRGLQWTAGLTVLAFVGSFVLGLLLLMLRVGFELVVFFPQPLGFKFDFVVFRSKPIRQQLFERLAGHLLNRVDKPV